MLRRTPLLAMMLGLMASFLVASPTFAQSATYELGPFMAIGFGQTQIQAEKNAWDEAWVIADAIESVIPTGHGIVDFAGIQGRHTDENTFLLEFYLVVAIYYDSSDGGPGGPDS